MREHPIHKGMILAAGLGTRLLPITERYPKPLVPVLNLANILHTLSLFRRNGISEVVINLFHLPDRIEEFFNDIEKRDFKISFSKEPVLLGTGGGVKKAQALLGAEPFVLAKCDFISNMDLRPLIEDHFKNEAWATMALLEDPEKEKLYSSVGTNSKGELCFLPKRQVSPPARSGIFTGVHVMSPEIFYFLEEKPSGINDVLYPALMEKHPEKARGHFLKDTFWFDTGDIPAFLKTSLSLLDELGVSKAGLLETLSSYGPVIREVAPGLWASQRTSVPEGVVIEGPVMLGESCLIEPGVKLGPYTVVGDRVSIGAGSQVRESVVLSHSQIPSQSQISNQVFFDGKSLS